MIKYRYEVWLHEAQSINHNKTVIEPLSFTNIKKPIVSWV